MNKRDLVDAISDRLGDKKSAAEAVNAVLETIQSAVAAGDKVAITGFGVFEKSERQARTGRNPATGAAIQVPAASVPRFRPGAGFKALVNAGNRANVTSVDGTKASAKADTVASAKKASGKKADGKKASGKKAGGKKASKKKASR